MGKTLSISKLLRIFVQVADDTFDTYDELDASEAMSLCRAYTSDVEEDMRYDEFIEGLARVGFDLLRGGGGGKNSGKAKTMVEIIDEILNVYLIKNEISIGKMKEVLR